MDLRMITDVHGHKCQLCGKEAELRPYGPNGEWICFECGMKDEETTEKQFGAFIGGEGLRIIDTTGAVDKLQWELVQYVNTHPTEIRIPHWAVNEHPEKIDELLAKLRKALEPHMKDNEVKVYVYKARDSFELVIKMEWR